VPSRSKAQQHLFGAALAAKRGAKPASREVAKVAGSMSAKQLKDFAATKTKSLPNWVRKKK
jgi:hypothetical protein